jgi:hypothetical protein
MLPYNWKCFKRKKAHNQGFITVKVGFFELYDTF